ncbi:sigma 54-interacting transcriptional regulator [Desulfurispira natronophila]|uniref:sigma 54-interacting transcriptional regulator n=1 Tax=Desulfurispira natronophila TaxID=682562 RepID=UPI0016075C40
MKILIVDDDSLQRDMLQGFLQKQGLSATVAHNGTKALRIFQDLPVQLVILDHRMPDINGDELLSKLKKINPMIRAIMITAFGAIDTAVQVMKLGADDFMEKPVDLSALLEKIRKIEQELLVYADATDVNHKVESSELPFPVVGASPPMIHLLSIVQRIAPSPWSVLIQGETGTGKELFASLIHHLSPRSKKPFVAINCAAIPENLFESELFGHEKGAFTGATARKKGRFEQADGGTLFLDEVGELPASMQAKLLRVLQEKQVMRVGGDKELQVDVRLIAATNRNLPDMVAQGDFREDLYYRLNVLEIEIPPLRQRREDIPAFVEYFLQRYSMDGVQFSPDALTTLVKYDFPGNVRELEHMIQRTVTMARGSIINISDLPPDVFHFKSGDSGKRLDKRLADMERSMLLEALNRNNWVQTRAAEDLGISERVLRYKMNKYDVRR